MADWKSPHINGFESERLREICRDHNAFYGEPPCWTMENAGPNGVEGITPCAACLHEWRERVTDEA